ncbi:hypothetical protein SUGI_0740460 [Cryptomeria japonica]|nr:hypothetical protein SUGI_0740460 [Cryptomeria japonica]
MYKRDQGTFWREFNDHDRNEGRRKSEREGPDWRQVESPSFGSSETMETTRARRSAQQRRVGKCSEESGGRRRRRRIRYAGTGIEQGSKRGGEAGGVFFL